MYRPSDVDGEQADVGGKYFHLLLVNVLRGEPLTTSEVWRGQGFGFVRGKLGQEYDSVEGGPHRPMLAGPGEDDSGIYVVYHPSQVPPEFIVTYTEVENRRGLMGLGLGKEGRREGGRVRCHRIRREACVVTTRRMCIV